MTRRILFGGAALALLPGLAHAPNALAADGCQLNSPQGAIQHVIVVEFDNTHLTRDHPGVPSDLEQMPHLLNFIRDNGVLSGNHHTPLLSRTANDVLTTLTGVYPDRHGVPIANSFRYFAPDGTSHTGVSFTYWTDPVFDPSLPASPTDTTYNILTADGHNAPAPWVAFTRAGCNVGAVGMPNLALANDRFDIPRVFGNPSPEYSEFLANPSLAFTDFVGIAIHCAAGSGLCASANSGRPDLLPDEPGGYTGFNALYGTKYVNPQLGGSGAGSLTLTDLNGQPIVSPTSGTPGFPGEDAMTATVSLAYVAYMQEHGVPITYAYISDAHDAHPAGPAYGPGEAGYVSALKAYDDAFDRFFTRLANDGITASNTLFVFTSDENDHFAGGAPTASCDGVNTPCTYSHVNCPTATVPICPSDNIGELNANMAGLLATAQGIVTPFAVHSDSAPTVYITGRPARDAAVTRAFERATAGLSTTNLYTGVLENMTVAMADPVEMNLLHMITADPARTPTFQWFALPDYFLYAAAPNCNPTCVQEVSSFAWNQGNVTPDIVTTWLGMAGRGVQVLGADDSVWSDHADVRPTILALVGLRDDYRHDGRVLFEDLAGFAVPPALRKARGLTMQMAQVYKQINAPVGELARASLSISTRALASDDAGDATYASLEDALGTIAAQRDAIAAQMTDVLEGAEFNDTQIDTGRVQQLIDQGESLLARVASLASVP